MAIEMEKLINTFLNEGNYRLIASTVFLFLVLAVIKKIINKKLDYNKDLGSIDRVKIKRSVSLYINLFFIVMLLVLWFSQVQAIFVSLFAIAAAIVIATKELIMNLMGGVLIKLNKHFSIGDRIEVKGVRGFVIDKSLTATKVLEIGPEQSSQQTTGDIIVIPNSIMLSEPVQNDSYFKNFSIKSFNFKVPEGREIPGFEKEMLNLGKEICKDYHEDAAKVIETFCRKEGLVIPSVAPRTKLVLKDDGSVEVLLKIPVKNDQIADVEQLLIRHYLKVNE